MHAFPVPWAAGAEASARLGRDVGLGRRQRPDKARPAAASKLTTSTSQYRRDAGKTSTGCVTCKGNCVAADGDQPGELPQMTFCAQVKGPKSCLLDHLAEDHSVSAVREQEQTGQNYDKPNAAGKDIKNKFLRFDNSIKSWALPPANELQAASFSPGYSGTRKEPWRDFPGSRVVRTLRFHRRGHGFHPWLWN